MRGNFMKTQYIFIAAICIVRPILPEQIDQEKSVYQITLNIRTDSSSGADQQNKIEQTQGRSENTSTKSEQPYLQPDESAGPYMARNGLKIYIFTALMGLPAVPLAVPLIYLANRIIVQNLLNNAAIVDTINPKIQAKLAQEGKMRVPDIILFPYLNKLKHKFFD